MDVFDLSAKLTLDKTNYEENLSSAATAGSTFGSKLSSAVSTGSAAFVGIAKAASGATKALTSAVGEVAEYGDSIDKSSQKLGVSRKFYQEWEAVLQHSGTSMSSMTATFKKLSTASQNASKSQVEAFNKLGLSIEQVSSMSTEELFTSVISGLQNMEEGTERTAVATQLLGKGATELGALFNTSAEDTQKMIDTVNNLGGVLSDDAVKDAAAYQDSLQDMQTAFSGVKNAVLAEFLPALTSIMNIIAQFVSEHGSEITATMSAFGDIIKVLADNFDVLAPIIGAATTAMIAYKAASSISGLIGTLTAATQGQTIAQTLLNAVMNANPFVLVATLIAGLVAAIVVLWNKNEGFRNAVTNAWNAVKNGISAAGNAIKTVFSNLGASVESLKENVKNKLNNMTSMFSNLGENFKNIGSNIVKGVWNGISSGWTWLTDKVKSLANSLVDGVKNVLGIHSPSRVFAGIGNFMTQGLEQGWEKGYDGVRDTITGGLDFSNANAKIANIPATDAHMPAYAQQAHGDTYIPIYLGSELLDTVLIRAGNRINYRSGGRVNV